jgi:two-component system, NarL family, response regulator LiaR
MSQHEQGLKPPGTDPTRRAADDGASGGRPVRVAVVNDYQLVVSGVAAMLEPFRARVAVVELDVRTEPSSRVDVALYDTYGQSGLGFDRVRSMVDDGLVGAVAVYTWSLSDAARAAAQRAGARGLIAKAVPAEELVRALEALARGDAVETGGFGRGRGSAWPGGQWGLSSRESETLALLTTGLSNKAIAERLYVSENTVRTHLKAVYHKLGVTNRSQAVARALGDPTFAMRHDGR